MIRCHCPQCKKTHQVGEELAGRELPCECGNLLRVPSAERTLLQGSGPSEAAPGELPETMIPGPHPTSLDQPTVPFDRDAMTMVISRHQESRRVQPASSTGDVVRRMTELAPLASALSACRYDAGELIAKGGMGAVHRLEDTFLRRTVAVKTLLPEIVVEQDLVRRFIDEARVTGQLEHPNIVPVHELGVGEDGAIFFTMKRVSGESLNDVLQGLRQGKRSHARTYTLNRRLRLFLSVCNALAFAHSRGVLHRDLKPENVMTGEFGEVLVMDWGLAKIRGKEDRPGGGRTSSVVTQSSSGDSALTLEGQVFGTPMYMPPEQAAGKISELDERADIYSLGAILYELLTLRRAINGSSLEQILDRVRQGQFDQPGEGEDHQPVPRELAAIVMKAMATDKADRYRRVTELVEDIEAYLSGYAVSALETSAWQNAVRWVKRNRVASLGMVATLVALVTGVFGMLALQKARTDAEVQALLRSARQKYGAGDFAGAQAECTKAMALAPGNPAVRRGLRQAMLQVAEQQQAEQLAGIVRSLEGQLVQEKRKTQAMGRPDAKGLTAWYSAHNRLLNLARELHRLQPDEPRWRAAVVAAARALAHQMVRDRSFETADLMIEEAAALGLEPALLAHDRWQLRQARTRSDREAQARLRAFFERLRSGKVPRDERERMMARVSGAASPAVVRLLIDHAPAADAVVRLFAIEALGLIGDGKTTSRFNRAAYPRGRRAAGPLREATALWLSELRTRAAEGRIDAVGAISLVLLGGPVQQQWRQSLEAAQALARLGDPRGAEALALARWEAGFGGLYWRRTAAAQAAVPLRETAPADAAPLRLLVGGLVLLGRSRWREAERSLSRLVASGKHAALAHLYRGLARARSDQLDQALADLRRAEQLAPTLAEAPLYRAELERARGRYPAALAALERALTLRRAYPAALVARAMVREAMKTPAQALADYALAIQADPRAARAYEGRGRLLLAAGEAAQAITALTQALALEPDRAELRLRRAAALRSQRVYQLALDDLSHALAAQPGLAEAYYVRALVLLDLQRRSQARASLEQAVVLQPEARRFELLLGQLYLADGDARQALALANRLLRKAPEAVPFLLLRTRALLDLGAHDRALATANRTLKIEPDCREALLARARVHKGKQLGKLALADLRKLLALAPGDPAAHLLVGEILLDTNRLDQAIAAFNRGYVDETLRWMPRQYQVRTRTLFNTALTLRGQQRLARKKAAEAIADFSRAIEVDPRAPDAYHGRARAQLQRGDAKAALEDLRRTVRVQRAYPQAWIDMALLLARAGGRAEAVRAFEQARRYIPDKKIRAQIDAQIRRLRK